MTTQSAPISELVEEIESEAKKGDEHLIAVAMLVREVKMRIESGEAGEGVKWLVWAKQNFRMSKTKLYELNTIACAKDPKAALERYRHKNREYQKRYNERASERDPERCAVIALIREIDIEHVRKVRKLICDLTGE